MRIGARIFGLCLCWFLLAGSSAIAGGQTELSSSELLLRAREFDGRPVVYRGEVIGEVMIRQGHAWVNVHDGVNAIGLWMPRSLAQTIMIAGGYRSRGDLLRVSGEFHRACAQHGGDLDIHVDTLEMVRPGAVWFERMNLAKRDFTLVLLGIVTILWISKFYDKK